MKFALFNGMGGTTWSEVLELWRHVCVQLDRRLGLAVQDGVEDDGRRVAWKRSLARRHLVQHDAETPYVAAGVHVGAAQLLGRHVPRRSDRHARMRTHVRAIPFRRFDRGGQLRQSEVEDLGVAVGTQHDVLGLDVAMHEAAGMRRRQSACELDTDVHHVADRQRPPL